MDATDLAQQAPQKVEGGLHETARKLTETGQEWSEKVKGTARDAGAAADLYLHEYAWTSVVLIAAATGILGYFLGARRR